MKNHINIIESLEKGNCEIGDPIEKEYMDDIKKNILLLPDEKIVEIYNLTCDVLRPVERYIWPKVHLDYDMLMSVDYSDILNKQELKDAASYLIENNGRYSYKEMLVLFTRDMFWTIWKLDVLFLTHLKQCFVVNCALNECRKEYIKKTLSEKDFNVDYLPFWLRNTSSIYAFSLSEKLRKEYKKIEVIPAKTTDIQAQCRKLGRNYIVTMDCGLYTYLQDWCKLLIMGYRLRQYSFENGWNIREPVQASACFIILVVDIICKKKSVFFLPPPAMNHSRSDIIVVRQIVESQISFLLGHEFGHIICHSTSQCSEKEYIEIEADNFSIDTLRNLKGYINTLNKEDQFEQLPENDIQDDDAFIRRIEAVDILFSFYELYYYICEKKGYQQSANISYTETLKSICARRANICKKFPDDYQSSFLDYVNDLVARIRKQVEFLLKEEHI